MEGAACSYSSFKNISYLYVYGQKVLLRTDNTAVSLIRNLKKPTGQTARWLEELGTYNLTINHRSGRKHSKADALSRRPCKSWLKQERGNESSSNEEDSDETSDNIVRVCTWGNGKQDSSTPSGYILDGWQPDQIRQAQLNDPDIALLLATLDAFMGQGVSWHIKFTNIVETIGSITNKEWDALQKLLCIRWRNKPFTEAFYNW